VLTSDEVARALLDGWSADGRETLLQLAVDGRWEEAQAMRMPASDHEVRSVVRQAGQGDVAVEFEWLGRPLVFVGARRAKLAGDEATSFEDCAARVAGLDPDEPALALAELAGGTPSGLDHVELGAANAWQSVGPLRLWTRGKGRVPRPVQARLDGHPALRLCSRPVAIEVAFSGPRACWIGIEVSSPSGHRHAVEGAAVEAVLSRLGITNR
jgi:hypothetical protein